MIEIPKLIACSYAYYLKYYKLIKKLASHDYLVTHRLGKLIIQLCVCAQLCPTLCNPMDSSPPGSSVHGILRQEYWTVLPFPLSRDLPNSGIEPTSPESPA